MCSVDKKEAEGISIGFAIQVQASGPESKLTKSEMRNYL